MLKALKTLTYATRRLKAGDTFEPRNRSDRRVLIALKKAVPADGSAPAPKVASSPTPSPVPAPTPTPTPSESDDIAALRKEYASKTGKKPFNGWPPETLRKKIAEA